MMKKTLTINPLRGKVALTYYETPSTREYRIAIDDG